MSNHKEITIDEEKVTSEEQFRHILRDAGLSAACTGGWGNWSKTCYRKFADVPIFVEIPRGRRVNIVLNIRDGKVVDLRASGVMAAGVGIGIGIAAAGIGYALAPVVPRMSFRRLSSVGAAARSALNKKK